MLTHYQTDPGKVRSHNEDSVTIVRNLSGDYLLIVADGMGGHKAGEVASSMAVTTIGSRFQSMSTLGNKVDAITWLKEIIEEVNTSIIIKFRSIWNMCFKRFCMYNWFKQTITCISCNRASARSGI